MKRFAIALVLVLILAIAAFPFTLQAQDDMMDSHVCDSTLITLLLIAEGDYGFQSMQDLSTFEKGQYAPFFEAMMMEMEGDMGDEEMMDEDMGDEEMMDEEMSDDMMDMVMLTPGHIEGEDEACTELREELEAFFYEHWTMMGEEEM